MSRLSRLRGQKHGPPGQVAQAVDAGPSTKPLLLQRMERFTFRIALLVAGAVLLTAAVSLLRGAPLQEVFLLAVALAVSAIPEGLPVALTVALAVGMNRMFRRNAIARRLIAVEALGSCTFIASDKTGTLTLNELTARRLVLPDASQWQVSGEGIAPSGRIGALDPAQEAPARRALIRRLGKAVTLANEGFLGHRDGDWSAHGDAVDVALLVMARKAGLKQQGLADAYPPLACLGFESERAYCATLSATASADCEHICTIGSVKGAWERLEPMCMWMAGPDGNLPLDADAAEAQVEALAFEKAEGNELARPPRPPGEAIFNRLMVERVLLSALVIGALAFLAFQWLLAAGYSLDEARNGTLLLMVSFENVQVFNSRSETRSAFRHNLLSNPLLLFDTAAAQLVHIGAMYTPWLRDVLGVQRVSLAHWSQLLGIALSLLLEKELHKLFWERLGPGR